MMKSPGCMVVRSPSTAVGAFAFDDEAQGGLRVAVARRDLAGQDQLQAGVERRGHAGGAGKAGGVLEDQHAAHGLFGADDRAGLHDQGADFVVFPEGGQRLGVGLLGHEAVQQFLQGRHAALGELGVVSWSGSCPRRTWRRAERTWRRCSLQSPY